VQLVCAFRLMFPDVGIVLSTREERKTARRPDAARHHDDERRAAAPNRAVTPARAGKKSITPNAASSRNSRPAPANGRRRTASRPTNATGQFNIGDERPPQEVAALIRKLGYEPVWKDWDAALMT
jgi:2-iminoacetate synthase